MASAFPQIEQELERILLKRIRYNQPLPPNLVFDQQGLRAYVKLLKSRGYINSQNGRLNLTARGLRRLWQISPIDADNLLEVRASDLLDLERWSGDYEVGIPEADQVLERISKKP